MPTKNSYPTITDQFCGCGGSSAGAKKALARNGGGEIRLALNHWKLAIETHNTNFPDTLHDCTDVSACDPRRYPSTDILITSPECTTHSPAGGNTHKALKKQMDMFDTGKIDPATERSRATMYDVVRFAEYHHYNFVIVENVVEAMTKWALFDNWLGMMHKLGYEHKLVFRNSMHHYPTPQSRDRMYVVFWKKGNRAPDLNFTPRAWCGRCGADVDSVQSWKKGQKSWKYKTGYLYCCPRCTTVVEPYYFAAFNCINWRDIGTRIGDRPLKQFRNKKGELQSWNGRTDLPLSPNTLTRIEYGRKKYGGQGILINDQHTTGVGFRVNSLYEKVPTVATDHKLKLVTSPFLMHTTYSGEARGITRPVNGPGFAQISNSTQAVVMPFVVNTLNQDYDASRVRGGMEAMFAQTTRGDQFGVAAMPYIVKIEHAHTNAYSADEAAMTQTGRQSHMLINPARGRAVTDVFQTQAGTAGSGIVLPYVVELHGGGSKARPITDGLNSVTAGGVGSAVVNAPFTVTARGESKAHGANEALTTISGMINHGLVSPESWQAFVSYYYGTAQASHTTDPLYSARTTDNYQLITYQEPKLEDMYYRMLVPAEIQLAMAFEREYIVLGNSRDKVKQLGNAVTPPVMEDLVDRCLQTLR